MATIVIDDLRMSRVLDRNALASIRGGGAPWVFGWIRPHVPGNSGSSGPGAVANFYQINNTFHIAQLVNQVQIVDITNSAPGSTISVALEENGLAVRT